MIKIEKLFTTFENLLKSHDWTFDFSDDHSVWTRGNEERSRLRSLALTLGEHDAERVSHLWNALCPMGFERSTESFEPKKPEPKWRLREGVKPNRNFRFSDINKIRRELGDENLESVDSRKEAVFRLTWGVEPSEIEREIGFIFHFPSHPELAEIS
tara:strand:+ start:1677 stop:2144 length:468 start_codon:yes stop_codon:yes gene_type:complete